MEVSATFCAFLAEQSAAALQDRRKMGMSMDKVIVTVAEHGNTSAASIPLALDAGVRSGQIQRGQHLLLEGVGGGFAWGAVVLKY
jgi:3-oxoacyl-[acyl-carrier-protein] synthase-3